MSSEHRVVAPLVIGSNGATSLHGSSRALSSPEDRTRFLALRKSAAAIVIGGATFRSEPYDQLAIPLYVASKRLNSQEFSERSNLHIYPLSPTDVLDLAKGEISGLIVIEGGKSFLSELLQARLVDQLLLTRSPIEGDSDFWEIEKDLLHYQRRELEDGIHDRFEIWSPKVS